MKKLLLALVAAGGLTTVAAPVGAVPPEETSGDFSEQAAFDACAFPLELQTTGSFVHRHYHDKDGNVVRHQSWFRGTDTLTNPSNGKTVSGKFAASDSVRQHGDDEFGPFEIRGLMWHFNVPGHGAVLMDAGRVVFQLDGTMTVSGPHQVLEGDFEELCAALA